MKRKKIKSNENPLFSSNILYRQTLYKSFLALGKSLDANGGNNNYTNIKLYKNKPLMYKLNRRGASKPS